MEDNAISSSLEKYSLLNQENGVHSFFSSHSDFFAYGPSQKSILMVNNLLNSSSIPQELKKSQLKQIFFQTFNETYLNEIQIAVWSICLPRFVWNSEHSDLWLSLISSAIFSKELLGENVEYLISKFSAKFLNFKLVYSEWKEYKNFEISVKEINQAYKRLNRGKYMRFNYNYYVDDILFQYLPYNNPKKAKVQGMMRLNGEVLQIAEDKILPDEIIEDLQPLPLIGRTSDRSVNQPHADSISHLLNFDV